MRTLPLFHEKQIKGSQSLLRKEREGQHAGCILLIIRSKRAKRSDVDDKPNSAITTSAIELSSATPTARSRKSQNVRSETHVASSRTRNAIWSSEFLLTNPKSKLATCNLTV